jgi:holo-[acyl-carrier protein] synthase
VSAKRERSSEAGGRASGSERWTGGPAEHSIGIDLLEIERLERALGRRPRLAERLFTDGERAYAASRAQPSQHLAARFCAKEAVAKALGLHAWNWRDVEIVGGEGPPSVVLRGAALARATSLGVDVSVSLTHTRRDAAAAAVAFPRR